MSLIDDLARLRELQGKPPLASPHIIQGFEPGSPPVPAYHAQERDIPADIEDEFLDGDPLPASPLIPARGVLERRRDHAARQIQPASPLEGASMADLIAALSPVAPVFQMTVIDNIACWKGREVILTEDEQKQVRIVVLRAIQRELDADLAPLVSRRRRKPQPKPEPASVEPRKRGRPRKVTP